MNSEKRVENGEAQNSIARNEITNLDRMVLALMAGKQITNGPQSLAYDSDQGGFLCCATPGCCDTYFMSMAEVIHYLAIDGSQAEGWELVEDEQKKK